MPMPADLEVAAAVAWACGPYGEDRKGSILGVLVGAADEASVGAADGAAVGAADGLSVGAAEPAAKLIGIFWS